MGTATCVATSYLFQVICSVLFTGSCNMILYFESRVVFKFSWKLPSCITKYLIFVLIIANITVLTMSTKSQLSHAQAARFQGHTTNTHEQMGIQWLQAGSEVRVAVPKPRLATTDMTTAANDVDWDVKDLVNRPNLVATVPWSKTALPGTILWQARAPDQLLATDYMKRPFDIFTYWNGDMEVSAKVNGSIKHQGIARLVFVPQGGVIATSVLNLPTVTSLAGVYVDAPGQQQYVLEQPYFARSQYMDTSFVKSKWGQSTHCGTFALVVIAQLDGPGDLQVAISARFPNSSFVAPRPVTLSRQAVEKEVAFERFKARTAPFPAPMELVDLVGGVRVQRGVQGEMGIFDGIGDLLDDIGGIFGGGGGGKGNVYQTTNNVNQAGGNIYQVQDKQSTAAETSQSSATSLDLSAIPELDYPEYPDNGVAVYPQWMQNVAPVHGKGFRSIMLDDNPFNKREADEQLAGTGEDCMGITPLICDPTYFGSITWRDTDTVGTVLWSTDVTPCWHQNQPDVDGLSKISPTRMEYVLSRFAFWTGALKYVLMFASTQSMRGRLGLAFLPGWSNSVPSNLLDKINAYLAVYSLGESDKSWETTVDYMSDTAALRMHREDVKGLNSGHPGTTPDFDLEASMREISTGKLVLVVLVPLTSMETTNKCDIVVLKGAGEDFEASGINNKLSWVPAAPDLSREIQRGIRGEMRRAQTSNRGQQDRLGDSRGRSSNTAKTESKPTIDAVSKLQRLVGASEKMVTLAPVPLPAHGPSGGASETATADSTAAPRDPEADEPSGLGDIAGGSSFEQPVVASILPAAPTLPRLNFTNVHGIEPLRRSIVHQLKRPQKIFDVGFYSVGLHDEAAGVKTDGVANGISLVWPVVVGQFRSATMPTTKTQVMGWLDWYAQMYVGWTGGLRYVLTAHNQNVSIRDPKTFRVEYFQQNIANLQSYSPEEFAQFFGGQAVRTNDSLQPTAYFNCTHPAYVGVVPRTIYGWIETMGFASCRPITTAPSDGYGLPGFYGTLYDGTVVDNSIAYAGPAYDKEQWGGGTMVACTDRSSGIGSALTRPSLTVRQSAADNFRFVGFFRVPDLERYLGSNGVDGKEVLGAGQQFPYRAESIPLPTGPEAGNYAEKKVYSYGADSFFCVGQEP